MTTKDVNTTLKAKAQRYEDMNAGQCAAFQAQLTKALRSSNLGVKMAAQALIVEFNISHPLYNAFAA